MGLFYWTRITDIFVFAVCPFICLNVVTFFRHNFALYHSDIIAQDKSISNNFAALTEFSPFSIYQTTHVWNF